MSFRSPYRGWYWLYPLATKTSLITQGSRIVRNKMESSLPTSSSNFSAAPEQHVNLTTVCPSKQCEFDRVQIMYNTGWWNERLDSRRLYWEIWIKTFRLIIHGRHSKNVRNVKLRNPIQVKKTALCVTIPCSILTNMWSSFTVVCTTINIYAILMTPWVNCIDF